MNDSPPSSEDNDVLGQVTVLIRSTFRQPSAQIDRDTTAPDVDGWDSLSHTVLLLAIEKHFGVRLPMEQVFDLDTVGDLVDLIVETKTSGGGNG